MALAPVLGAPAYVLAQTGAATKPAQAAPAAPAAKPLELQTLDSSRHTDPFPPVNPKFFNAATPTVDTVNSFLTALWGYDPNRIWRVEAIQTTSAPGVSKVVVFVTDKNSTGKVASTSFFVTPDGKHAIADAANVISFGAKPFEDTRKMLQERADGAYRGSASKNLMLVEFADLQCPHCKEAQATMDRLAQDFPNARIVFQSFPLVDIHPFAFKAAAYGYCVTKQKNDAFFPYASAVFDNQASLTPEMGDKTLKDAVVKAGLDAATIDTCANTVEAKNAVEASIKLAQDAAVEQTPMLSVNGHLLPLNGIPYETLKTVISYQAVEDGVTTGATAPRTAPSLGVR